MSKLIHDDLTLSLSLYIGSLLRKTRVENGLAGRELAELVNVSQQQISRYERGTTSVDMNADEVMDFFYKIVVEAGFTPEFISKNSYAECVCNLNNN